MKNYNIFLLAGNGNNSLDSFIDKTYLNLKKNNKNFNKDDSLGLYTYNLKEQFRNINEISGKIYIYKEPKDDYSWVEDINLISQKKITLSEKKFSYKVLFIVKRKSSFYAISYSHGYILLNPDTIVPDFGLNVSQKMIEREKLKSIKNISVGPTISNTHIYSSEYLQDNLNNQFQNISVINTLAGKVEIDIMINRSETRRRNLDIQSRKGVTISGDIDLIVELIPLAYALEKIYLNEEKENNITLENGIEKISDTVIVKKLESNSLLFEIDRLLDKYSNNHNSLKNSHTKHFNLEIPEEYSQLQDLEFRISGSDKIFYYTNYNKKDFFVELCHMYTKKKPEDKIDFLKKTKLILKSTTDESSDINKRISLFRAIYFDDNYKGEQYFLLKGIWYKINYDFYQMIKDTVDAIPDYTGGINFDSFNNKIDSSNENNYNARLETLNQNKLFSLDTKCYRVPKTYNLNPNSSVEYCDLIKVEDDNLVLGFVKRGTRSSQISYVLDQARSTSYLLKDDPSFTESMNELLPDQHKINENNKKNITLIIGIISGRTQAELNIKNSNLFPVIFNISLVQFYQEVRLLGYNVSLVNIPTVS